MTTNFRNRSSSRQTSRDFLDISPNDFRDVSLQDEFQDEGSVAAQLAGDHDGSMELTDSTNRNHHIYNIGIAGLLVFGFICAAVLISLEFNSSNVPSGGGGSVKNEAPNPPTTSPTILPIAPTTDIIKIPPAPSPDRTPKPVTPPSDQKWNTAAPVPTNANSGSENSRPTEETASDECLVNVTLEAPKQFQVSDNFCCGTFASRMSISKGKKFCPKKDGSNTEWCIMNGDKSFTTYSQNLDDPQHDNQFAVLAIDINVESTYEIFVGNLSSFGDTWYTTTTIDVYAPNGTQYQTDHYTGEMTIGYYYDLGNGTWEFLYENNTYSSSYVVDMTCYPGCDCKAQYRLDDEMQL